MLKNSSGSIYYGMHFYPGLAQYDEGNIQGKVYLNEDTLRKMDPTFAGKPIFVEHVDEVDPNLDELRKEADGWVVESFFNSADGKHWVKMVLVSEKAKRAIQNGFRLSNSYHPRVNGKPGIWNGIEYQNEVVDGEYDHLAIVKIPRYEESVIMTPEEFKNYNENLKVELSRIANSISKPEDKPNHSSVINIKYTTKETNMGINFWKRQKVENSIDFEGLSVSLPRSGKEFTLQQIVNAMDAMEEEKKENMASPDMMVKLHDGKMCNVGELLEKYKNMSEAQSDLKSNEEKEPKKSEADMDDDLNNEDDMAENSEEEEEKAEKNKLKNAIKLKKKQNFQMLKNAPFNEPKDLKIELGMDKTARGKARYGS